VSSRTNKERLTQNNAKIEELIEKLNGKSVTNGKYNIESIIEADGTQTLNITDWDYVPTPSFDPVFANNSWTQIAQASQIIKENNYTSAQVKEIFGWDLLTDTKVDLGTDGILRKMHLLGFNHDDLSDGSGKAGIAFGTVDCEPVRYPMNDTNTNAGGYPASLMRTSTLPTIFSLLSSELQSVIKNVDKKSANGGKSNYSETVTTSENIFLFSQIEVLGTVSAAQDGANEGIQYEYYATIRTSAPRIKMYDKDADGEADTTTVWWLRSCFNSLATTFKYITTSGSISSMISPGSASNSRGVAFGFCI
jgi:hypothetical protein